LRWGVEHGSEDPEVNKKITYGILGYYFHFTPSQIDKMDATMVEEFLIILHKLQEIEAKIEHEKLKAITGGK